jgi:hypothetical protein
MVGSTPASRKAFSSSRSKLVVVSRPVRLVGHALRASDAPNEVKRDLPTGRDLSGSGQARSHQNRVHAFVLEHREGELGKRVVAKQAHVICHLVRAAGIEPAQALRPYGFSYHFGFRRRHLAFVVWTIPSPWLCAVGAARLVSTPSPRVRGLARDCQ